MDSTREVELLKDNERLCEENRELRQENGLLRQKVDLLIRRIFGASSEKLDPQQLELLLQQQSPEGSANELGKTEASLLLEREAESNRSKDASARRPRDKQPRLPADLPVIETVLEPAQVQQAPQQWRRIGQEVSEQLDYEPGRFLRRRLIRPKYVRRQEVDGAPMIAPLPGKLLERGIAAPGLLAQIITAKYCAHLPLYRQEQIFRSQYGVTLPRQSMANWMGLAADSLRLIYEAIKAEVFAQGYVQIDETPIS